MTYELSRAELIWNRAAMFPEQCERPGDRMLSEILRVDSHLANGGIECVRAPVQPDEVEAAARACREFGLGDHADLLSRIGISDDANDRIVERYWYANDQLIRTAFDSYLADHPDDFAPA